MPWGNLRVEAAPRYGNAMNRRTLAAALVGLTFATACGPRQPVAPAIPLSAVQQCRADVERKRSECNGCWFWLLTGPVGAGVCFALCGGSADALERQCTAYAFEAEHTSRIQADLTVHEGAPR
jgi:hypothetical protein